MVKYVKINIEIEFIEVRNDFLVKRVKKIERKYLIRRVACSVLVLITGMIFIGIGQVSKKDIGTKSARIKNSYNIDISKEELDKMYNELNVKKTSFKWVDEVKKGNKPDKIVLHHSAQEDMTIDEVHQKHIDNGWSGIGYHYFIRKDGSIYKGREEEDIGAHVKDNNTNTLGICLEGNFEKYEPTHRQGESILDLLRYLFLKYDIKEIKGHRDLGQTLCPGENLKVTNIKNKLDSFIEETIKTENTGK